MSDTVTTALIMALASIICQVLINASNRRKRDHEDTQKEIARAAEEARKEEKLEGRLRDIEAKLDRHNGYAEKLTQIWTDIAVIKNDIKTLHNQP